MQVVTHLCYSDFDDIMPAIHAMDADVLTIENSRSGDEMIHALAASGERSFHAEPRACEVPLLRATHWATASATSIPHR